MTTNSNNLLKLFHFISFHFVFAAQPIEAINVETEMEMKLEIDGNGYRNGSALIQQGGSIK